MPLLCNDDSSRTVHECGLQVRQCFLIIIFAAYRSLLNKQISEEPIALSAIALAGAVRSYGQL